MTTTERIELSEASILRLEPGDIVALKVTAHISEDEAAQLQERWQRVMRRLGKENIGVVILSPDIEISVVRQA